MEQGPAVEENIQKKKAKRWKIGARCKKMRGPARMFNILLISFQNKIKKQGTIGQGIF